MEVTELNETTDDGELSAEDDMKPVSSDTGRDKLQRKYDKLKRIYLKLKLQQKHMGKDDGEIFKTSTLY